MRAANALGLSRHQCQLLVDATVHAEQGNVSIGRYKDAAICIRCRTWCMWHGNSSMTAPPDCKNIVLVSPAPCGDTTMLREANMWICSLADCGWLVSKLPSTRGQQRGASNAPRQRRDHTSQQFSHSCSQQGRHRRGCRCSREPSQQHTTQRCGQEPALRQTDVHTCTTSPTQRKDFTGTHV